MAEGDIESAQDAKARDVGKAFQEASRGLAKATQNKLSEYSLRVLKGERIEDLMQGLPQSWEDEVKERVVAIKTLKDEDDVWQKLQNKVQSESSFDRKAFGYGWKIIQGADRREILQGLSPAVVDRVDTYINETFKLAVETVSRGSKKKD